MRHRSGLRAERGPLGVALTASALTRKVTASGVIWLDGHAYYVSRRLAGQVIPIAVADGRLTIDVTIPLRKVYQLRTQATPDLDHKADA